MLYVKLINIPISSIIQVFSKVYTLFCIIAIKTVSAGSDAAVDMMNTH
jgi:hypothetical protein